MQRNPQNIVKKLVITATMGLAAFASWSLTSHPTYDITVASASACATGAATVCKSIAK